MTILVTGGARGLGAVICRALAQEGHSIAVHYRSSKEAAEQLVKECSHMGSMAETIYGDFSQQATLEKFISAYLIRFPETKGIVHNVGNYLIAPIVETLSSSWLELFQTNFFAPVFLTQALLPSLKRHQGAILTIGVAGLQGLTTFSKATAYAATKQALLFYTRSLAKELASFHIRVNAISPGYMENAVDLQDPEELPFKRAASLEEVAYWVMCFFDPKASYITGQNLEIAGGIGL